MILKLSFGILFITIIACASVTRKRWRKRRTKYSTFPIQGDEKDMNGPVHIFEGVDYDLLPPGYSSTYSDCESVQQKCLTDQPYLIPVCVYTNVPNVAKSEWLEFDNQCEMLREDCYQMMKAELPKEGFNLTSGKFFFMGDGRKCEYYQNRAREAARQGRPNQLILPAPTSDFMLEEMKKKQNKSGEIEKEIFNNAQGGSFKSTNPQLSRMSVGAGHSPSRALSPYPQMLLDKVQSYLNNISIKEKSPTA